MGKLLKPISNLHQIPAVCSEVKTPEILYMSHFGYVTDDIKLWISNPKANVSNSDKF